MKADGSIVINVDLDEKEAQKELNRLTKEIKSLEEKLSKAEGKKSPLELQAESIRARMKEAAAEAERYKQAWLSGAAGADREEMIARERAAQLGQKYDAVLEKINKVDGEITETARSLDVAKNRAGELAQQVGKSEKSSRKLEKATKRASKSMGLFATRLRGILLSAFVFNILSSGLRNFTQWLGNVIKSNDQAAAAIARLKGALLTLAQPIVDVIIPAFISFINILTALITKIAQFVAALFGTTLESASEAAEALYNEQNAIEGVGDAAKKATKQLAAFDEINTIKTETAQGGGGVGVSSAIAPNFDTIAITDGMEKVLDIVEKIGAALLGWTLSKTFMDGLSSLTGLKIPGKVALGISLVAAGGGLALENIASILAGEYGATSLKAAISEAVSGLMIGAGLVAMGASGWAIPIAIALTFTISDLVANWEGYKKLWALELEALKSFLKGDAEGFWQNISDAYLQWMYIDGWIQKLVKAILGEENWQRAIDYLEGGGSLLDLFAYMKEQLDSFLEWVQSFFPSGISDATASAYQHIQTFLNNVQTGIDSLEQFLLGFFTWFDRQTNGQFHETIETARRYVAEVCENMRAACAGFMDFIEGVFAGDWKKAWNGIAETFKGTWNGIISFVEGAINVIISGLNSMISSMNKIKIDIPKTVFGGGYSFGLSLPKLSGVSLPRLATGAVIPPNREFMAVLGDNKTETEVVSPLSTMKQAMIEALREAGGIGGDRPIEVNVILDKQIVGRVMVNQINDMTRAAGKPVLLY